jgi:hypothetical protein
VKAVGGGTPISTSTKSEKESEGLFDSAVQEVESASKPKEHIRNVFITFHVDDEAQVNLLRSQSKSEDFDIVFRDYSVKEPFDEKWKSQCKERISQTSAVICMIGENTAERPAVNWELEEAYKQGKKVIGVRIYRDQNHPIPEPLKAHGARIIDWDLAELRKFLDEP